MKIEHTEDKYFSIQLVLHYNIQSFFYYTIDTIIVNDVPDELQQGH